MLPCERSNAITILRVFIGTHQNAPTTNPKVVANEDISAHLCTGKARDDKNPT